MSFSSSSVFIFNIGDEIGFPINPYNWNDIKYQQLPNVVGMSLDEAKKVLRGYKLEYSGDGLKVIYQSPSANLYVADNSTVKLMLSN